MIEQMGEEVWIVEHENHRVLFHEKSLVQLVNFEWPRNLVLQANLLKEFAVWQVEHEKAQLGDPAESHSLVTELMEVSSFIAYICLHMPVQRKDKAGQPKLPSHSLTHLRNGLSSGKSKEPTSFMGLFKS